MFVFQGAYQVTSGDGNLQTFRDYVQTLPMNDSPDVFGLHENASITVQFNMTKVRVFSSLTCVCVSTVPQ